MNKLLLSVAMLTVVGSMTAMEFVSGQQEETGQPSSNVALVNVSGQQEETGQPSSNVAIVNWKEVVEYSKKHEVLVVQNAYKEALKIHGDATFQSLYDILRAKNEDVEKSFVVNPSILGYGKTNFSALPKLESYAVVKQRLTYSTSRLWNYFFGGLLLSGAGVANHFFGHKLGATFTKFSNFITGGLITSGVALFSKSFQHGYTKRLLNKVVDAQEDCATLQDAVNKAKS